MEKNCWEYKKCGREPGGKRAAELGVCPAAINECLNGTHHGKNAGRSCWVVAGTFCKGEVQGNFAKKFLDCEKCEFYQLVKKEESPKFQFLSALIKLLNKKP